MQGKKSNQLEPLAKSPRSEDLQKLLKAAQIGNQAQQAIVLPGNPKFVIKVQIRRAGSGGLGRARAGNEDPIWTLLDSNSTLWEYGTSDLELISNLVEEAVYATSAQSAPSDLGPTFTGEQPVLANPRTSGSFAQDLATSALASMPATNQTVNSQPGVRSDARTATLIEQQSSTNSGMQLSGNLSELGVFELIQTISVAKMTGRLDITNGLQSVEVFFEEGAPRRASFRSDSMTAVVKELSGEEVIIEGMTWKTGFFQFNSAMKSSERSPMRRLDLLLMEGAALRDYLDSIETLGLTEDSVPVRLTSPSEAEFEQALESSVPVDMQLQKSLYMAFDGKKTLADVVNDSGIGKTVWLPIIFNLSKSGLVGLKVSTSVSNNPGELTQSPVVKEAVKEAYQQLFRTDTGLMSYHLFLHLLEVEYQRALKLRLPFSLILFSVQKTEGFNNEQLSSEDLKLVSAIVRAQIEPFDYVGHYQTLDIGVLLPHRPAASARECANKIVHEFNTQLAQSGSSVRFVWSVGIGCVPEDGIKLDGVIAKAEKEKLAATAQEV
jgi:GGDEF domain-containing protein